MLLLLFLTLNATMAAAAAVPGTLDPSFDPGTGPAFAASGGLRVGSVLTIVPLAEGKAIVGGFWDRFNGQPNPSLARLAADGAMDLSFVPQLTNYFASASNLHVRAVVRQPDGKLVVSWLGGIDRLGPDGDLDPLFQRLAFVLGAELVLQRDGKILVAGPGLMRLHPNGAVDTAFARGHQRFEGEAKGVLVQSDGKIVFVGDLRYEEAGQIRHVGTNGLGRLNPDGTPDPGFQTPVRLAEDYDNIYATGLQPDDSIILGGAFIQLGSVSNLFGVARLHPDGASDSSFQTGRGVRTLVRSGIFEFPVDGRVFGIECLRDGKILVGGAFLTFNDLARTNLARLNADGSVDTSFDPGPGHPDRTVDRLKPTQDGKEYFISGLFARVGGVPRPRLARIIGSSAKAGRPPLLTPGVFNGLVFDPEAPRHDRSGFITLKLTPPGTYSGSMILGGRRLAWEGSFDAAGESSAEVAGGPAAGGAILGLELEAGGGAITGMLSDAAGSVPLRMNRAALGKGLLAESLVGTYTLLVRPDPANTLEIGDGFGHAKVDLAGEVSFEGDLADGTSVVQRVGISELGEWPFYVSLYGGLGSIFGWVRIDPQAGNALAVRRSLHWTRPSGLKPPYAEGFTNEFVLLGSPYAVQGAGQVLRMTNGVAILSGGDLGNSVTNTVRLDAHNKITNLSSNGLRLMLFKAMGEFKGSFTPDGGAESIVIRGALLPRQNLGGGFFSGANRSGQFYFGP